MRLSALKIVMLAAAQPSLSNGTDLREKPYALFHVKVGAKPVRLQ